MVREVNDQADLGTGDDRTMRLPSAPGPDADQDAYRGFAGVETLPIEHETFRVYRLGPYASGDGVRLGSRAWLVTAGRRP